MPLMNETVPMEVEVPAWGDDFRRSTFTQLFRVGSYLPEAMRVAVHRKGMHDLDVGFAACSVGAEMDSFLAHYNRGGYQGVVEATGYDINGQALDAAERGVHTVIGGERSPEAQYREVLKEFGFEVREIPDAGEPVPNGAGLRNDPPKFKLLEADAAPVRENHTTAFAMQDLREPIADAGKKDLVFANNLLYHLSDEQAARVIRNLASTLADHGILSLGLPSSLINQEVIEEELGMEPVFTAFSGSIPVMLGGLRGFHMKCMRWNRDLA